MPSFLGDRALHPFLNENVFPLNTCTRIIGNNEMCCRQFINRQEDRLSAQPVTYDDVNVSSKRNTTKRWICIDNSNDLCEVTEAKNSHDHCENNKFQRSDSIHHIRKDDGKW